MTTLYHLEHRFVVAADTMPAIRAMTTPGASYTWVGNNKLQICTWRGVPGRHCDVLLPCEEWPEWATACDIGRKEGRYDGAVRWRISFRRWDKSHPAPAGRLSIEECGPDLALVAIWPGGIWAQSFPQLQYLVRPDTDHQSILIRQAQLYFGFLWEAEQSEVRALADEWACLPSVLAHSDISALNRDASQALYQLARNLGWHKLTRYQRERLGLGESSGQWQRAERVDRLRRDLGDRAPGVGRYTLDAAAGAAIHLPLDVCPQCHELADDCECQP